MERTHLVQLNLGTACISEYQTEVARVNGRAGFRNVGSVLEGDSEHWTAIELGLAELLTMLRTATTNAWSLTDSRVERQVEAIIGGKTLQAPALYSWNDKPSGMKIIDGRHRLAALESLGAKRAVVMVPSSQVDMFATKFP